MTGDITRRKECGSPELQGLNHPTRPRLMNEALIVILTLATGGE